MHFAPIFVYLCLHLLFLINNLSISYLFSLTCKYRNNEHKNDFANNLGLDFERVVYTGEFSNSEDIEDDDLPSDLLRLVAQDKK